MAFGRNPSYLKRQKEQRRAARAARKREERNARKQAKADGAGGDEFGSLADLGIGPDVAGSGGTSAPPAPEGGEESK